MKKHRFILQDPELVHQMARVLKLQEGENIVLGDGKGHEAEAVIEAISPKEVSVTFDQVAVNHREPTRLVTLYCALLKRENFEWVVQKATEVGVTSIVPIITRRTVKLHFKLDRLQMIAKEAAEQSGRGIVPVMYEPITFEQAIEQAKEHDHNLFFDVGKERSKSYKLTAKSLGIWIGPEGGWDPEEVALARQSKCEIVSLGSRTLRAETAAVIATYLATSV
ncbi:16S rRNA (uracil(1498)-N(3))-methyltransferase [Candidatus Uhrbacteria bacterium]|nr:16S rRNA (uracil(1498)-N(3))-methyltransferase [Candidatus Uhrbacteria bacterium]